MDVEIPEASPLMENPSEKEGEPLATPRTPRRTGDTILWSLVWDIHSPAPKNTLKGALVPRVLVRHKRRRKICLELHRITRFPDTKVDTFENGARPQTKSYYEECIVRLLTRKKVRRKRRPNKHQPVGMEAEESYGEEDESDDDTVTAGPFVDTGSMKLADGLEDHWRVKYRIPLSALSVRYQTKQVVAVMVQSGKTKQLRDLIFDSEEEAGEFIERVEREKPMEAQRAEDKLNSALCGLKLKKGEILTFLVEIVSAQDLPPFDLGRYSDPYVVCSLGADVVHRTKFISKTLDPIWTIKTHSLFILQVDSKKLFLSDGLVCTVMDYDSISRDEIMGATTIPPKTLYKANGERMVFHLSSQDGDKHCGTLVVRCRRATDYDKSFMAEFEKSKKATLALTAAAHKTEGGLSNLKELKEILEKHTKVEKSGPDAGVTKFKMKPGPDPKREEETEWMSFEQIEKEKWKDSDHWIDAGGGSLGRLYVEVIQCDKLPNLDAGGFVGNKTDAFVSLVFQDTAVRTDVISNSLSPRWMPWTRRAFVLRMLHNSSQLFLSVFDYDSGSINDHDHIGRVVVDIANLQKDTTYILKYSLNTDASLKERKSMGTVTIRLRMEIADERRMLLKQLEPPPSIYVNVKKRKNFRVLNRTVKATHDMDTFSRDTLMYYVEELLTYQHLLYYIKDGAEALVLWRAQTTVNIFGRSLSIPVHSMFAFFSFTYLVENPEFLPSFCFGSFAWLLLAIMGYRRSNPVPWNRCKSFGQFVEILIFGNTSHPHSIAPREGQKESDELLAAWRKRISDAEEKAKKDFEEAAREHEEFLKEQQEIGDTNTDISTKVDGGLSVDVFKPILHPLQLKLGLALRVLRFLKYVVIWEESYYSFWVTSGSMVLAVAFMFVPWLWFLKWTARILVWTLFGPWMKLFDMYYYSKIVPLTEEEAQKRKEHEREQRLLQTTAAAEQAQIQRERTTKLKAMKKYMFGFFITRVPVVKHDRYRDEPLPESTATPYRPDPLPLSELAMREAGYNRTRLPGQHLTGDMIPKIESPGFTDAPVGQATANPLLLDMSVLGVKRVGKESTTSAYVMIMSVVATALIVTWFGVPVLTAATQKMLAYVLEKIDLGSESEGAPSVFPL